MLLSLHNNTWLRVLAYALCPLASAGDNECEEDNQLCELARVHPLWGRLLANDDCWRQMYFYRFRGTMLPSELLSDAKSWRERYQEKGRLRGMLCSVASQKLPGPPQALLCTFKGKGMLDIVTQIALYSLKCSTRHYRGPQYHHRQQSRELDIYARLDLDSRFLGSITAACFLGANTLAVGNSQGHVYSISLSNHEAEQPLDERRIRRILNVSNEAIVRLAKCDDSTLWVVGRGSRELTFRLVSTRLHSNDLVIKEVQVPRTISAYAFTGQHVLYTTSTTLYMDQSIILNGLDVNVGEIHPLTGRFVQLYGQHSILVDVPQKRAIATVQSFECQLAVAYDLFDRPFSVFGAHESSKIRRLQDLNVMLTSQGTLSLADSQVWRELPLMPHKRKHPYAMSELAVHFVDDDDGLGLVVQTGKHVHLVTAEKSKPLSSADHKKPNSPIRRRSLPHNPSLTGYIPDLERRSHRESMREDVEEATAALRADYDLEERLEDLRTRQLRHLPADMTEDEVVQYAMHLSLQDISHPQE